MLQYLAWLVHSKKFQEITLQFQIPGHTRNSCDRAFGHVQIKNAFKAHDVFVPSEFISIILGVKNNQGLYLGKDDDTAEGDKYPIGTSFSKDWSRSAAFKEAGFRKAKAVLKYYIFSFSGDQAGTMIAKIGPNDTAPVTDILIPAEKSFDGDLIALPRQGFTDKRRSDIYENYHEYIPEEHDTSYFYPNPTEEQCQTDPSFLEIIPSLLSFANTQCL